MSVLLSELNSPVLLDVQQVPDVTIDAIAREVVIDFFRRSKLHAVALSPISIVAGTASYALTNPTGYQISHIKEGTISTFPLTMTSPEQLDLEWSELSKGFAWRYAYDSADSSVPVDDWRFAVSDTPGLLYQPDPNTAVLVGTPTQDMASALSLKVVIYPDRTVTSIPDWIFNTYWMALRDGIVARLKKTPNRPFSDRTGSVDFEGRYEQAILDAESASLRAHKRNDQVVRRTRVWP